MTGFWGYIHKRNQAQVEPKISSAYYKQLDTFWLNFSLIPFVTTAPYVVLIFMYLFVNISYKYIIT